MKWILVTSLDPLHDFAPTGKVAVMVDKITLVEKARYTNISVMGLPRPIHTDEPMDVLLSRLAEIRPCP